MRGAPLTVPPFIVPNCDWYLPAQSCPPILLVAMSLSTVTTFVTCKTNTATGYTAAKYRDSRLMETRLWKYLYLLLILLNLKNTYTYYLLLIHL